MNAKQVKVYMGQHQPFASQVPLTLGSGKIVSEFKMECKCGEEFKDELVRGSINLVESDILYRGIGICDSCHKIVCLSGTATMLGGDFELEPDPFVVQSLFNQ